MNNYQRLGWSIGLIVVSTIFVLGCGSGDDPPDAYGNFEAVETTVSAYSDGELTSFEVREGDRLSQHQVVGHIDTVQLDLGRSALAAQRNALSAQVVSVNAEAEVLIEQERIAQIEKQRIDRLYAQEAATQKQVDDIDGRISVIDRQVASTRSRASSLQSQMKAIDAQTAQIDDRINKSTITNPVDGIVLTTFVEPYELVRPGAPLYRIANLSSLIVRAYVSAPQLTEIAIGDVLTVSIDGPDGTLIPMEGTVTWISSQAEFTPRMVQTRDERTNLVYAFKIRVLNPSGQLKIGMPADVRFASKAP